MIRTDLDVADNGRRLYRGLLADLAAAMARADDGTLVGVRVHASEVDALLLWSELTGHPVVERERTPVGAKDRPVRMVIRKGKALAVADDEHALGARLWLYTNFHCNLECDYCCVRSSPTVAPRMLPMPRVERLTQEAKELGFRHIFLTGGEPFLHPEILAVVEAATDALPTTLLTNAMLFQGKRRALLAAMPTDRLVLQVSLDSPTPALHDHHRGAGSWEKAWDGIQIARSLGFRVRIAATCARSEDRAAMEVFLREQGFAEEDRLVRPIAQLGNAKETGEGIPLSRPDIVPEVTITGDGVYWHPVGVGETELRVSGGETGLKQALDQIRTLQTKDAETGERLASVFHCA